ncbi:MAG: hypothetical protein K6E73_10750 [Bacteroidales bacterium]|nr:hypothetical protein [Bacteroidales bacterium]
MKIPNIHTAGTGTSVHITRIGCPTVRIGSNNAASNDPNGVYVTADGKYYKLADGKFYQVLKA